MFDEQVGWAVGVGVDFIIAETMDIFWRSQNYPGSNTQINLPAVVTMAIHRKGVAREDTSPEDPSEVTYDRPFVFFLNKVPGF